MIFDSLGEVNTSEPDDVLANNYAGVKSGGATMETGGLWGATGPTSSLCSTMSLVLCVKPHRVGSGVPVLELGS